MSRWIPCRLLSPVLLLVPLTIAFPLRANADSITTLDFDAATSGSLLYADYYEDDFRMQLLAGHYDLGGGVMQIDTHTGWPTIRFDRFGAHFDLLTLDVVAWVPNPEGLPLDEIAFVTSSRAGYAEITTSGTLTFSGMGWEDVSWIAFTVRDPNRDTLQDNLNIDNVRLRVSDVAPNAVPEPATIIMLAPILLAFGLRRKYKGGPPARQRGSASPHQQRSPVS